MKHWLTASSMALAALAVSACARFAIYDDPEMKGPETGIRYYTTRAFVLVTKRGDKTMEANVFYLPDLSRPQYARAKTGIGANKLSMTFGNSILTQVNQETDTKIPDVMNSLGGLMKVLSEMKKVETKGASDPQEIGLYEVDTSGTTPKLVPVQIPPLISIPAPVPAPADSKKK